MAMFQRATKQQSKLRMTLDGPSGAGKTFTALTFGTQLAETEGGRLAVIDTERGSAAKYADIFDFDHATLDTFSPQNYIELIKDAEQAGYPVLVIDSLSHAWEGEGGVLDMHDDATRRSASKNSWAAWRDVTPLHRRLVDTILQSKMHIITTMRSKMDYVQNEKGKIEKVGLAPIQRQGMEYEFDIVADMDYQHNMIVSKSRCFVVADDVENKPGREWFAKVVNWLKDGAKPPHWIEDDATRKRFWAYAHNDLALSDDDVHKALGVEHIADFGGTKAEALELLKAYPAEAEQSPEPTA